MSHQHNDERRKAQRSKTKNVCCWALTLGSFYSGAVGNLSPHGLFISASKEIPIGSLINIEFLPPDTNKVISVKSRVIWSRTDRNGNNIGVGVEFVSLSEKDKETIAFYLDILEKTNHL